MIDENRPIAVREGEELPLLAGTLSRLQHHIIENAELINSIQDRIINLRDLRSPNKEENKPQQSPAGIIDLFEEQNAKLVDNNRRLGNIMNQLSKMF